VAVTEDFPAEELAVIEGADGAANGSVPEETSQETQPHNRPNSG
jgi:hypothetical protein